MTASRTCINGWSMILVLLYSTCHALQDEQCGSYQDIKGTAIRARRCSLKQQCCGRCVQRFCCTPVGGERLNQQNCSNSGEPKPTDGQHSEPSKENSDDAAAVGVPVAIGVAAVASVLAVVIVLIRRRMTKNPRANISFSEVPIVNHDSMKKTESARVSQKDHEPRATRMHRADTKEVGGGGITLKENGVAKNSYIPNGCNGTDESLSSYMRLSAYENEGPCIQDATDDSKICFREMKRFLDSGDISIKKRFNNESSIGSEHKRHKSGASGIFPPTPPASPNNPVSYTPLEEDIWEAMPLDNKVETLTVDKYEVGPYFIAHFQSQLRDAPRTSTQGERLVQDV